MTLIEYFKLIPGFARISIDDKIRLLRNNFGIMLSLNESTSIPDDDQHVVVTLTNVFGNSLGMGLHDCIRSIRAYRCDPVLVKLVLTVQSLSSGANRYQSTDDLHRVYDNSLEIFESQCFYTELLWRYVRSRSMSAKDAVKFFNKLICDLLQLVQISALTDDFVFSFTGDLDQTDPLIRSILVAK